mmetsp:Transcript_27923/g.59127  ORF Transcript_27923/g.59127 Transcript_27923/m.59127 type:complete len:229 (-) Transcript_27923:155-841(-)
MEAYPDHHPSCTVSRKPKDVRSLLYVDFCGTSAIPTCYDRFPEVCVQLEAIQDLTSLGEHTNDVLARLHLKHCRRAFWPAVRVEAIPLFVMCRSIDDPCLRPILATDALDTSLALYQFDARQLGRRVLLQQTSQELAVIKGSRCSGPVVRLQQRQRLDMLWVRTLNHAHAKGHRSANGGRAPSVPNGIAVEHESKFGRLLPSVLRQLYLQVAACFRSLHLEGRNRSPS